MKKWVGTIYWEAVALVSRVKCALTGGHNYGQHFYDLWMSHGHVLMAMLLHSSERPWCSKCGKEMPR